MSSDRPVSSSTRSTHGKMKTGTASHAACIAVRLYSPGVVAYFFSAYSSAASVITAKISASECITVWPMLRNHKERQ